MTELTDAGGAGAIPDGRKLLLEIAKLNREIRWLRQRMLPTLVTEEYPRADDVAPAVYDELARDTFTADQLARRDGR